MNTRSAIRHLRAALKLHRRVLLDPDTGLSPRNRVVCAICSRGTWEGPLHFPCPTYLRIEKALAALDAPVKVLLQQKG